MNFHPSQGYRCLYVRNRHGVAVGLVMTHTDHISSRMGWSLCHRKVDVFRKRDARRLAFERFAVIPSVELPEGLRNTPMNRALVALAGDESVPQTVRSAAKRELAHRVDFVNHLKRAKQNLSTRDQTVAAMPSSETVQTTMFGRLRHFLGF